jgi:DNA-binding HxlR family transcriptional regulator
MAERSYQQICGMAQALDLLGERWTLLVLRELMLGPKRFTALREALDGVNPNLLSARLRKLEQAGVVRRVDLPPPATGVRAYALTERGEDLREPLAALAIWGYELIEPEEQVAAGWQARGSWLAQTRMAQAKRRGALAGVGRQAINVEVDGERFVLTADGEGDGSVRHGCAEQADAELSMDMQSFHELLGGERRPSGPASPLLEALVA